MKTVCNVLVAAAIAGFGPCSTNAQTVSNEGNATSGQIAVLPEQLSRNYAPWDAAKAKIPAIPLPAYINADTGLIAGGSNPLSNNIFRTRVFDLDFSGVTIPLCPDGSVATHANVVVNLQFTGDRSDGIGVDMFTRIFVNGNTVLNGVDRVGNGVNGMQVIKFKQLVPVGDLGSVQLLVSFQTLENGTSRFNWTMDTLGVTLSPDCPVTGDSELDFPLGSPNTAIASDPGGFDVIVDVTAPEGTISGWDASDMRFRYDPIEDLMYVAVNTLTPGSDADGDGDPARTSSWLSALGGVDIPNYGGSETVVVVLDIDQDGIGDVILGTPVGQSLDGFQVARYNPAIPLFAAPFGFTTPLTGNPGQVLSAPQAFNPIATIHPSDLIMTISNWSTLPFSGPTDEKVRSFSYLMFQGSADDLGVGEEWSPGVGEFGPVEIPKEPAALGSIGNQVWFDTDNDGIFDNGEEDGIPGVVVLLLNSGGNEIGRQVTDEDGKYLFTDLPQGVYTVKIANSNFDDCGAPIYKSGKWALGNGLEFNGTGVTFQPGVAAVSNAFSISALVHPVLGEWGIIVEKGNSPWPYILWVSPSGQLCLALDGGSGPRYFYSTGMLTGSLEHIGVIYDGSTVKFFINGALDSTVPVSVPSVSDATGDLFIGRHYRGTINDVRIYDTAIDAVTIAKLATMDCGALAALHQSTVIGGILDNTNKATPQTIGLAEGQNIVYVDFGFVVFSSIGNTVWQDTDNDGIFEPHNGELGIQGVLVVLTDTSGNIQITTTDANGQYLFSNLISGHYSVNIANSNFLPGGLLVGYLRSDQTYNTLIDGLNRSDPHGVNLGIDVDYILADFGVYKPISNPRFEGLTPGYWKQPQHAKAWTNYVYGAATPTYKNVFGVLHPKGSATTLLQALGNGGGDKDALGRHAVAALLNANNPNVNYKFTKAEIISMVQSAYANKTVENTKDILATQNELGTKN